MSNIIDKKAKVLVKRKGDFWMSKQNSLKETAYFAGSENPMVLSRNFNEIFICNFDLRNFPFDTQTCMIVINANNKVGKFLQLTPVHFNYTGPVDLQNFEIINWYAEMDTSGSHEHIRYFPY